MKKKSLLAKEVGRVRLSRTLSVLGFVAVVLGLAAFALPIFEAAQMEIAIGTFAGLETEQRLAELIVRELVPVLFRAVCLWYLTGRIWLVGGGFMSLGLGLALLRAGAAIWCEDRIPALSRFSLWRRQHFVCLAPWFADAGYAIVHPGPGPNVMVHAKQVRPRPYFGENLDGEWVFVTRIEEAPKGPRAKLAIRLSPAIWFRETVGLVIRRAYGRIHRGVTRRLPSLGELAEFSVAFSIGALGYAATAVPTALLVGNALLIQGWEPRVAEMIAIAIAVAMGPISLAAMWHPGLRLGHWILDQLSAVAARRRQRRAVAQTEAALERDLAPKPVPESLRDRIHEQVAEGWAGRVEELAITDTPDREDVLAAVGSLIVWAVRDSAGKYPVEMSVEGIEAGEAGLLVVFGQVSAARSPQAVAYVWPEVRIGKLEVFRPPTPEKEG